MTAPTKNVVDLATASTLAAADKVLMVDISDTTEGPLGTVKIATITSLSAFFDVISAQGLTAVTNNGVVYVDSSGAPTSGSGLQFDGVNASITGTGQNSAVLIGKATDAYSAVSLNNSSTPATMLGLYGSSGDATLYIKTPTGGGLSIQANNTVLGSFTSTGLAVTGAITPTTGVYLGGTAAANLLDSYEEGTFTPTATFATPGTVSTTGAQGTYTKVGNLVTVVGRISITKGTATGDLVLGGLPFTAVNTSLYQCAGSLSTDSFGIAGTTYQALLLANTTAPIALAVTQATGSTAGVAAGDFYVGAGTLRYSFSYHTA
jgi:hypothetical protein